VGAGQKWRIKKLDWREKMIRTKYGSEVKITAGHIDTGEVTIQRIDDNKIFSCCCLDLRATDGLPEIVQAIKDVHQ
jgi:hypothetical protein